MAQPKRGLGRGLDSLLSTAAMAQGQSTETTQASNALQTQMIAIDAIVPSPFQPRRSFDEDSLRELADSIKSQGVIQPIIVRAQGDGFELVAGERRLRAAKMAGLSQMPTVIRKLNDNAVAAMALIENIQREDLGALEEAEGMSRLLDEFGLTHQQLAETLGRSRSAVSNALRLLDLSDPVKDILNSGDLGVGHARAMLTLAPEAQLEVAEEAVREQLSVRQVEERIRRFGQTSPAQKKQATGAVQKSAALIEAEKQLTDTLDTQVSITQNSKGKGRLTIDYASLEQLNGIISRLKQH